MSEQPAEYSGFDPTHLQLYEKYGFTVLPERSSGDLGIQEPVLETTAEGLVVNGQNDTAFLRGLTHINELPIHEIEARMRPGLNSDDGFLGADESLTDVLAQDNDLVQKLGVTHVQLANFLRYAQAALDFLTESGINDRTAFEYNNRVFTLSRSGGRGPVDSPFRYESSASHDYSLVCLDDGSALNYSGLMPDLISKYGFYEGRGTHYRVPPESIAQVAGFIEADPDDPVARFVQHPEEPITFSTRDQFERLENLKRVGLDLLDGPNYTVTPAAVADLVNLVIANIPPQWGSKKVDSRLFDRLVMTNLIRQDTQLSPFYATILVEEVPRVFPQFQTVILEMISKLRVAKDELFMPHKAEEFMDKLLSACAKELQQKTEDVYALTLLERLNLEDEPTATALHNTVTQCSQGEGDISKDELSAVLKHIPDFLEKAAPPLKQPGVKNLALLLK